MKKMKEFFYYFDLLYFYVYVSLFNHFIQFSFFYFITAVLQQVAPKAKPGPKSYFPLYNL